MHCVQHDEQIGDGYGLFIKREMDTVFRKADSR